jgi:hypothetical protein
MNSKGVSILLPLMLPYRIYPKNTDDPTFPGRRGQKWLAGAVITWHFSGLLRDFA